MNAARSVIFVGRDAEIAFMDARLASAADGRGTFTVVTGPAGIGKTRLLDRAADRASELGSTVLRAANYAHVRAPFGPFADVLRDLRTAIPAAAPPAPADAALFSRLAGGTPDAAEPSHWDKRRLFVIAADALARAAERTPVAVFIDDMQWADPESLELAGYLATRIEKARVAIVIASREREDDDAVEDDLSLLPHRLSSVKALALGALDEAACRTMITAVPGSHLLEGRTVDEICRRSDGNPFYLETLAALARNGTTALPKNLQQTLLRRLGSLGAGDRATLETAAALGRTFLLSQLARAADGDERDVLHALRHAFDAGVIEESGAGFRFRHERVRMALYDSMLAAQRRAIHRRIVLALEPGDASAGTYTYHWHGAGEPRKAAEYAEIAGDEANALNAHASARDRYLAALESGTLDADERARINEKLARVFDRIGDSAASARQDELAIERARETGRTDDALRLEVHFANVVYRAGDVDRAIAACLRVTGSPRATPSHLLQAHTSLATFYAYRAEHDAARKHIAAADALEPERLPIEQIRLEWARATSAVYANDDRWFTAASKAVEIAERSAPQSTLAMTLMSFAAMTRERGRAELASVALQRAIAIADENGLSLISAYGRCELLDDLATRGELERAFALILEIGTFAVKADVVRMLAAGLGIPVLVELERTAQLPGLFDDELLETAFGSREPFRLAPLAAARAYEHHVSGRKDACRTVIERALPLLGSPQYIGGPLLLMARCADDAQLLRIAEIFASGDSAGLMAAQRTMVEAMARKSGSKREADLLAERALTAARSNRAPLLAAFALEFLGRRDEALEAYRAAGAQHSIRRLRTKRSGPLSDRESEVAEALRLGLTNRAIAERLTLSERTVEHHVAAILAKTGVRSRAEFMVSARTLAETKRTTR